MKQLAEVANVEADKLTAKLLSQKEDYEEQLGRQAKELSEAKASAGTLSSELCTAQTYAKALKESMNALEDRVKTLDKAKQQAEEAATLAGNRGREAERRVRELESAQKEPKPVSNLSTEGTNREVAAQLGLLEDKLAKVESSKTETERMVKHLQSVNDDLRAQVKSWKSKAQSMSGELGKLVRLSKLEADKEELLVELKLMEATKMEAEDELSAYKRALVQFADQAKSDERSGNGTPWTNRPRIFDHLYKKARASLP